MEVLPAPVFSLRGKGFQAPPLQVGLRLPKSHVTHTERPCRPPDLRPETEASWRRGLSGRPGKQARRPLPWSGASWGSQSPLTSFSWFHCPGTQRGGRRSGSHLQNRWVPCLGLQVSKQAQGGYDLSPGSPTKLDTGSSWLVNSQGL